APIRDRVRVLVAVVAFLVDLEDAVAADRIRDAAAEIEETRRLTRQRPARVSDAGAAEATEIGAVARLSGLANAIATLGERRTEGEPASHGEDPGHDATGTRRLRVLRRARNETTDDVRHDVHSRHQITAHQRWDRPVDPT